MTGGAGRRRVAGGRLAACLQCFGLRCFSLHRTPSSSTKEARVHKVRSGSSDTMAKQRPCGGGGRGRRQRACQVYHQAGSLELP
ncbi:hypothetical protein O3P69_010001 [Scylla paramamosain]|uniref:Secreted protein n=1 Tax=Scylla paramamosain TaxID=85552 RepID=A0AAW0SMN7_SCYPA